MTPRRFFSNPWVGGIGSLASMVGLLLAVYFYVDGQQSRHLTINVNPAKATVVKGGQTSKLSVSYDNHPITSDITAAQIEIWNAGSLSIRPENILQPLIIKTVGAPILEATVTKNSRPVTGVTLDSTDATRGELRVSCAILERGDGAVVQIIYGGTTRAEIGVAGIIEGQGEIKVTTERKSEGGVATWFVVLIPFMMTGLFFLNRWLPPRPSFIRAIDGFLYFVMTAILILYLWSYFHRAPSFISGP